MAEEEKKPSSTEAAESKEEAPKEEPKKEEPKAEAEKKEEKKAEEKPEAKPAAAKDKAGEEEKEVEIPKKFQNLVGEIEKMTVLDLAELVKLLEKKFGVSAQAPAAAAVPAAGAEPVEEKTEFNIELQGIGDKKIEVIKAVRDITEKGLKEAKDLVDAAVSSPQMVKENVKKEEAEEIKKKLVAAGAKVELK